MKALSSSSRHSSSIGRSALVVIALGLVACGSSNKPAQAPAVGGGPSSAVPAGMEAAAPLLGSVQSAVPGLSSAQAATGVGSLLGLAQQNMSTDQFAQIANTLPGTDALIGGAQKSGLPTTGLTGLSSLTPTLAGAGISPEQVSQMVPAVADAITKSAGPSTGQAFLSAVK